MRRQQRARRRKYRGSADGVQVTTGQWERVTAAPMTRRMKERRMTKKAGTRMEQS